MSINCRTPAPKQQLGAITLGTILLMLILSACWTTLSAHQQLIALWTARYQTESINSRIQAESGNWAYLANNRYMPLPTTNSNCTTQSSLSTCSSVTTFKTQGLHGVTIQTAVSDSLGTQASVSRSLAYLNWLTNKPPAALIVDGSVSEEIELHLAGNPDGGSSDMNIDVWASGTVTPANSSIHLARSQNQNLNLHLPLDKGIAEQAIKQSNGGSFPDDLFSYLFGISTNQYLAIKESAINLSPEQCSSLDSNSTGLYWIEGDGICELATIGQQSNSVTRAVILVLHGVPYLFKSGAQIHGIVLDFLTDPNSDRQQINYFAPDSLLNGSLLSNHTLQHRLSGVLNIVWQDYSAYFADSSISQQAARVLVNSSWSDYP